MQKIMAVAAVGVALSGTAHAQHFSGTKAEQLAQIKQFLPRANAGDTEAMCTLALVYAKADSKVTVDPGGAQSFRWAHKAALAGYKGCYSELGTYYSSGYGVSPNKQQARQWYAKALLAGDARAAAIISVSYRAGWDGLPKDTTKSIAYME